MNRRPLFIVLGALLLGGGVVAAADFYLFLQQPVLVAGKSAIFEIEPGASLHQIAEDLRHRGLLARSTYWKLLARLQDKSRKIKAGEYRLQGPLTSPQLLDRLVTGKTRQFSLTLVEGWTFRQVMDALVRHPYIKQTLSDSDDVMALLGNPGMYPEGWFFPDTYHFPRDTTDLEFLRRSHEAMKERLSAMWKVRDADLSLKSPYEALILASIVEKEAAVPEERPLIAAVFLSRLRKGMPLQTDPTVIYGLGDSYDGDIRHRDLRRDTPYNTYTRKGLPPTPIAMPGAGALEAAMHPAQSDALFFVARKDGSHHFSATYDEHRRAVIEHQLDGHPDRYNSQAK